jgi:tetratricopeptide (TPR) repeat protein
MAVPSRNKILVCCLLIAVTLAAYWQVHGLSFVTYDDRDYVTENPRIQGGLSGANMLWAATAIVGANWHPVTLLSHMTDCQLFGLEPAGHHLTSLALHIANVLLLFWVLQLATGFLWRSAFVAALFAVHPLNVQSVAWIAERKNVLSTLFFLLTIWAYIWYTRSPNWKRYICVSGLFILGLMSKPMLVTLPFVLLLLDYWPLERWKVGPANKRLVANVDEYSGTDDDAKATQGHPRLTAWHLFLEKVPLILLSVLTSVITVYAQHVGGALSSTRLVPIGSRIGNALVSYVIYLYEFVSPTKLAAFYPYPTAPLHFWQVALAAAALLGTSALAFLLARRFKFLTCGWLWYLGTLLPVIGLIQVGGQSRADRYAYVPLIGIFILLVWGVAEIAQSLKRDRQQALAAGICVLALMLLLAVMIGQTRRQVSYWENTTTLFEHAEQVTTGNYVAYSNLGYAYISAGRFDDAAAEFSKANPGDPTYADSQQNLGMMCLQKGEIDQAISHLKGAIEASPGSFDAYNKLGGALADAGRLDEAAACFRKVLEIRPNDAPAYANLGSICEQTGDPSGAISFYEKAIDLLASRGLIENGNSTRTMAERIHLETANLLIKSGKSKEAEAHFSEALRLDPKSVAARQGLDRISNLGGARN